MNVATFLSYCHVFPVPSPLRFIYVAVAVMTHYNFPCQRHQDGWFAGISMSSVSLKPQQQLKWHTGLVEQKAVLVRACVHVCSRVCMVLWLCIKPVAHECLHMCLYGGVGEHLSGATVHLHWLNQIKPTKTNIFVYYLVLDIYHLPSISSSHRWNLSNVMGAIGQVV